MVFIALGLAALATGCGAGDEPGKASEDEDRAAVASWVYEDTAYPVVSGIAASRRDVRQRS